jgi:hypothetical protein
MQHSGSEQVQEPCERCLSAWRLHSWVPPSIDLIKNATKAFRRDCSKLEEAVVYLRTIDAATYQDMRTKLTEDLTLAEMELWMPRPKRSNIKDRLGLCADGSYERIEPLESGAI